MNARVRSLTAAESAIEGSDEIAAGAFRQALLAWYDSHGRDLPWRVKGRRADPYRVWLSEVMLQQTTVAAVIPYFHRFTQQWPDVAALAAADDGAIMQAWAGLGYYSRARNLIAAARWVAHHGWPQTEADLRALPGVGAYTAAAIAAIAFDRAANVVDGNVERVMARLFAVETPLPQAKPIVKQHAARLASPMRSGDYAQALMDLGATVCTPRQPRCRDCPVQTHCLGYARGVGAELPKRARKPERPLRSGGVFLLLQGRAFYVERRPPKGLLGGMLALPSTPWRQTAVSLEALTAEAPVQAAWRHVGAVSHVFTHFALSLDVFVADAAFPGGGESRDVDAPETGLPTVFAKAVRLALGAQSAPGDGARRVRARRQSASSGKRRGSGEKPRG